MRPEGETREIMSGDRESEREREGGGVRSSRIFFLQIKLLEPIGLCIKPEPNTNHLVHENINRLVECDSFGLIRFIYKKKSIRIPTP